MLENIKIYLQEEIKEKNYKVTEFVGMVKNEHTKKFLQNRNCRKDNERVRKKKEDSEQEKDVYITRFHERAIDA